MVTRYTVALEAGGALQLVRQNVEGASAAAPPSRARKSWWAGARSTRPPSRGSQPTRRYHHEEKGRQPRPHRVARRRRPGRLHARSRRLRVGSGDSTAWRRRSCRSSARERAKLNLISWAGYVEPEWVKPFEQKTGCKVNNKRPAPPTKWSQLMRTGQYDGVSASGNATARLVAAGDVAPVNVEPRPQLQDDLQRSQGPALQHLRRRPLRDPARPRRQPADVERRRRQARPDLLGRDARPQGRGQVQGQDQRLRRIELHRRRRDLPQVPPARPGDRKPLRAERRTVRTRRSTC